MTAHAVRLLLLHDVLCGRRLSCACIGVVRTCGRCSRARHGVCWRLRGQRAVHDRSRRLHGDIGCWCAHAVTHVRAHVCVGVRVGVSLALSPAAAACATTGPANHHYITSFAHQTTSHSGGSSPRTRSMKP
jgi:hypothetical protein